MDAGDADGPQHTAAFEQLDDARDGFEAQVGDVGDVLTAGQDDLAGAVGQQADQAEDAVDGLAAAQGDEVGGAALGTGQRGEQGGVVDRAGAFRPAAQPAFGQGRGAEGVGAEKQGFAAEDVAGDGQAGEGRLAVGRGRVEADDAALQPPGGAGRAARVDFRAAGAFEAAAGSFGLNATVDGKNRANLKFLPARRGPGRCRGLSVLRTSH
jgi:hypothetical protein